MEPLQSLSIALGLSALSGVRLYLTVFLTSLSLNQGWLKLSTTHASLDILGSDAVMVVSGLLLLMEFLADKVPGFDSVWDGIHSFIRPVGATLVALQVLGDWNPDVKIVAALFMGGVAGITHVAKAGTRLLVNTSPEPVSNIALSTAEDIVAAGMFALLLHHPLLAGGIFAVFILGCLWVMPKCFRLVRANFFLIRQKLFRPSKQTADLPRHLEPGHRELAAKAFGPERNVSWAVEAISGKVSRIPGLRSNVFGKLISSTEDDGVVVFLANNFFRTAPVAITLQGCYIEVDRSFLSENLIISGGPEGRHLVLRFARSEKVIVARLAEELRRRSQVQAPSVPDPALAEGVNW